MPGLVCWHTPQGNKLGGVTVSGGIPLQAIINKRLGVRAGVSDVLAFHNKKLYCLELKSDTGKLTPAQKAYIMAMAAQGAYCDVAYGLDDALRIFEDWGLLSGKTARFAGHGKKLVLE